MTSSEEWSAMPIVTIDDVLKRAEQFEEMLAGFYGGLAERTTREGVRLLMDYMSRHRVRLKQSLQRLSPEIIERVRREQLRYEPQAADCRCFDGVQLPPGSSAREVLNTAITFDECLVRLYRQVLQQPTDAEVKDLFEGLIRTEQRDEIELKKIMAMDYF